MLNKTHQIYLGRISLLCNLKTFSSTLPQPKKLQQLWLFQKKRREILTSSTKNGREYFFALLFRSEENLLVVWSMFHQTSRNHRHGSRRKSEKSFKIKQAAAKSFVNIKLEVNVNFLQCHSIVISFCERRHYLHLMSTIQANAGNSLKETDRNLPPGLADVEMVAAAKKRCMKLPNHDSKKKNAQQRDTIAVHILYNTTKLLCIRKNTRASYTHGGPQREPCVVAVCTLQKLQGKIVHSILQRNLRFRKR